MEEDFDDQLTDSELYLESMIEIEENEGRHGGHDEDPFDRTDEYDENLDLNAPVAPTPDIPLFVEPRQDGEINVKHIREGAERDGIFEAFQTNFLSIKFSWYEFQTSKNAHFFPLIQDYLEAQSISEPCTIENSEKFEDFWTSLRTNPEGIFKNMNKNRNLILATMELDLLAAEMTGKIRPIFQNEELSEDFEGEQDLEYISRIFAVFIQTKISMKDFITANKLRHQFEKLMISRGITGQKEIESLLPIEEFWRKSS